MTLSHRNVSVELRQLRHARGRSRFAKVRFRQVKLARQVSKRVDKKIIAKRAQRDKVR